MSAALAMGSVYGALEFATFLPAIPPAGRCPLVIYFSFLRLR